MTNHTDKDWPRRVVVLGVGLLGGSVALSLRRFRPNVVLVGSARTEEKCERLIEKGIVNEATTSIESACQNADVVVVAAPVDRIAPMVIEAAEASPNDCLITDVGSTKAKIIELVGQHPGAARKFVAAHPIAGSEKTGFEHATAELFDGKIVIMTPSEQNEPALVARANEFWRLIGGEIRSISAAEHDTHLASISHVPHLVSALVARMATDQSRPLAGSGWDDITRVAAGDPTMWTAICDQNRQAIIAELERFTAQLDGLRNALGESNEAIHQWLAEAKRIKDDQ